MRLVLLLMLLLCGSVWAAARPDVPVSPSSDTLPENHAVTYASLLGQVLTHLVRTDRGWHAEGVTHVRTVRPLLPAGPARLPTPSRIDR